MLVGLTQQIRINNLSKFVHQRSLLPLSPQSISCTLEPKTDPDNHNNGLGMGAAVAEDGKQRILAKIERRGKEGKRWEKRGGRREVVGFRKSA